MQPTKELRRVKGLKATYWYMNDYHRIKEFMFTRWVNKKRQKSKRYTLQVMNKDKQWMDAESVFAVFVEYDVMRAMKYLCEKLKEKVGGF